jgi:hypothetical protein
MIAETSNVTTRKVTITVMPLTYEEIIRFETHFGSELVPHLPKRNLDINAKRHLTSSR